MARILGACRESGTGEASVSIENQEQRIRQWAAEHGHEVVKITVDKATSGGTAPNKRAKLGPWLTDPVKLARWDVLAAAKLDRLSRSVFDFAEMHKWTEAEGKKLVSVAEGYDFTTAEGALMAYQLIAFAEFERKRGGQRRGEAKHLKRDAGLWDGGRLPYGYAPDGHMGNWRLKQDKATGAVVVRMVNEAIAGKSLIAIANGLNAEGIPSPLGRAWRDTAVRRILTSPALIGHTVQMRGSVITARRDRDGKPIMFTDEPLITPEKFGELQRGLAARARSRGEPQARHLLWNVAYCVQCGSKLYGHRRNKHEAKGNYYTCRRCPSMSIRLEVLEARLEAFLLGQWGGRVLETLKVIPGDDHAAEIVRLEARAERWRADLADEYAEGLESELRALEARIGQLRGQREPDRPEWVPVESGETVAAYWNRVGTTARNTLLRLSGFRVALGREGSVVIQRGHPGQITDGLVVPHEPGDHESLFEVAGVNVTVAEDGVVTVA